MKRISKKQALWNLRHRNKLSKIRLKDKIKKDRIKRRSFKKNATSGKRAWWDISIEAPEVFSVFYSPYREEVLGFISDIQDACDTKKLIRLDFKNTRVITADAGILLRANMSKISGGLRKDIRIKCAPSKNNKINEVLTQIRILKLFNQDFNITPHFDDVVHWNLAEGYGADGEKYEKILGSYDGTLTPALLTGFYLGLTEAMTNTRQHAYPDQQETHASIPEWWMFSQEKDGHLSVVFCDLGVGIPESLPLKQPKIWKKILSVMKATDGDAEIIEGAVRLKRSSTELPHRGKGLTQLEDVINGVEKANLRIYSNKGCYALGQEGKNLKNYENSINGTLIYWSVPLS